MKATAVLAFRMLLAEPWQPNLARAWRVARLALPIAMILLALRSLWATYSQWGLFLGVGYDYGLYYAQTAALWSGNPTGIYRPEVLDYYHQQLAAYTAAPGDPLPSGTVPYPPLFAWLFTPFTLPNPEIGFVVWSGLNVLALVYLAWRVGQLFPRPERMWVGLVLIAAPPVWTSLYLGQPMILLACVVAEAYAALRAERDFRAGVWVAMLLLKPQYALLIGPLLVWKKRWSAVAGAMAGVAAILLASVVVAGVPALLAYPASLADYSDFRGHAGTLDLPELMINWRSLILVFLPRLSERAGLLLTLLLSAATVVTTIWAWRGSWAPQAHRFPAQMTLLVLATLVANYHSHEYGMVLLAAPLAALLAQGWLGRPARLTVQAAVALIVFVIPLLDLRRDAQLEALTLIACFAALAVALRTTSPGSQLTTAAGVAAEGC